MKPYLSYSGFFTVSISMVLLCLTSGMVNSATTTANYRVSAGADDGYAIIANKGVQGTKDSSLISSLQAETASSIFYTEDATYPNGDGWAWDQGQQTLDGNSLYIGTNNRDYFVPYPVSAMQFGMLGIFRGMEVISANFRIYTGDEMNDGRVYGIIHGGLPGWPYVFDEISLIEKTQASVNWDHIDAWQSNSWYYSPDLRNIVQELINKPNWKAGHPMTMVYSTSQKSPYTRSFLSSENGYDLAPKLKIRFRACVIFGYVRTAEGEPIKFATIDGGEYLEQRTTDSDGSYQFFVPPGWSGTLTVSKDNIVFKPAQYTYTDLNEHMYEQNFIEYKPKISGFVFDKYGNGVEQVNVAANNGGATGLTDANGFYEILVPLDWSGIVTANKSRWKITPDGISYSNVVTDQNDQNYSAYQPTISGHAKDAQGVLLAGVTIEAQGIETSLTDANGYYQIDVPYQWSGQITASMTDFGFLPLYRSYYKLTIDTTNQDFMSFQPKISGHILKADGSGMEGVAVTANNGGGSSVTDLSGYYIITVPYNWSGMVSVNKVGYVFIPPNRTYSNVIGNPPYQNYIEFRPVISGYVKDSGGTGVEGVLVSTDNGGGSDITEPNGYYEVAVPYDWSGTVTPSKTGWHIIPLNRSYSNVITNQTNQDYTAFQPKIYGHVTDSNGIGVEDVLVTADNGGGSDTTDINGYYEIAVPYDWSGTVTPNKTGWHITPLSRSYSNVITNQTNQDYTAFQPKISGRVSDSNGFGVESVLVSADNGGGSDTTDAAGFYEIIVPYNWSGTVTPNRLGWGITPSNRSYNNVITEQFNQDFLAVHVGIIVKPDGTGDFATIQAAIDAASDGDVITLEAGTYTGGGNRDVTFRGKAITVKGATGDPNDCIINCQGTSSIRHLGFKFIDGELANSVLKNVTITNGTGIKEYLSGSSYWIIGGGIYCNVGSPTIDNCIIRNNRGGFNGGGIYSKNGNLTISNCIFIDNTAHAGGGISSNGGNLIISNCTFTGNHAIGGGIAIFSSNYSTISNCIINENSSDDDGGGIKCSTSNINMNNCIISNNSSKGDGAGIHFRESNPTLNNCVINNNRAYDPDIYSQTGGGILASHCILFINNCTICGNSSEQNGGGISNFISSIFISNSILRDNFPFNLPLSGYSINYCNIQGGYAGTGNIDVDPLFKSDGYHLTYSSPCIDAGDPNYACEPNTTDIDGDPRIAVKVDMGADEISSLSALILLSPHSLNFQSEGLTSGLQSQDIVIKNYGAEILNWQLEISGDCNWLTASQMSGQLATGEDCEIRITVDPSGTGYGLHSCQLQIIDPGAENSPQVVTVNLEVLGPVLTVSPARFSFETALDEPNTAGQILSIQNTGYDTLYWDVNIPIGCGWLSASEISGQSTGELDEVVLSIDHNNIERGFYQCEILISAPDAENSPQVIPVDLRVLGMNGQRYVPTEYPTIQAAVDAALDGDEVIIEPGRYTGPGNYNIFFRYKAITVRSVDPNNPAIVAATIIEPNTIASALILDCDYWEQGDSIIDGLTIRLCIGRPAIHCYGGTPTIRNCIIEDNYNYDSPYYWVYGVECYDSNAVISNCVIRNNRGSGLRCSNSDLIVRNCIFTGNRGSYSYSTGGGFINMSFGGGILHQGGNLSIINCTFSGNVADVGGGICSFGNYAYINNVTISNCIFWDNDANDGPQIALKLGYKDNPPTVSVSYSDVQGGEAAVFVEPYSTLEWGKGNIDIDPCFAVPGHWELSGTPEDVNDDFWVDGDYHLKSQKGRWKPLIYTGLDSNNDGFINQFDFAALANSWRKQGAAIPADFDHSGIVDFSDLRLLLNNYPSSYTPGQWVLDDITSLCIDAGDPNSDRAGELWPHGSRINMGAYGGRPEASMSLSDAGNIADLIPDGCVGYTDMMMLTYKWLYEGFLLPEDLDRNGFVNFTDLAIFAGEWGVPCEADYPIPADGATDVNLTVDLSWTPGRGATSHDVYFGTNNPPPFTGSQTAATFDPGTMAPGTKYYWRINEVNPWAITTGPVWSFTTMFLEATNPNPADGATDVRLNIYLSWTAGYEATSHDVYFGTDNPPPFVCNQTATTFYPVPMDYNTTYYWRIDEVGTYGTITGTLWSFSTYTYIPPPPPPPPPPPQPPGQASNPNPADGTTGVSISADLSWTAGPYTASHAVYFGTTNPPPFIGNQTATTFAPGTMYYSTTYHWRIDEINIRGTTTGPVWSFTTIMFPPPP